jgi:hypothetical protein
MSVLWRSVRLGEVTAVRCVVQGTATCAVYHRVEPRGSRETSEPSPRRFWADRVPMASCAPQRSGGSIHSQQAEQLEAAVDPLMYLGALIEGRPAQV